MASAAGKSQKKDGTELPSDDSVSESKESGSSTSCESRSSSDRSCSAQLGWPIKKAANCSSNDVSEKKLKSRSNVESGDCDSMLKKQGSKVSGQSKILCVRVCDLVYAVILCYISDFNWWC